MKLPNTHQRHFRTYTKLPTSYQRHFRSYTRLPTVHQPHFRSYTKVLTMHQRHIHTNTNRINRRNCRGHSHLLFYFSSFSGRLQAINSYPENRSLL
jgi:hypothetical protein